MKKREGKFFVGIGVLLIIAGIFLLFDDPILGAIGIIFGVYNIFKGVQLLRGIQPMIIRKQQERDRRIDSELKDEISRKSNDTE